MVLGLCNTNLRLITLLHMLCPGAMISKSPAVVAYVIAWTSNSGHQGHSYCGYLDQHCVCCADTQAFSSYDEFEAYLRLEGSSRVHQFAHSMWAAGHRSCASIAHARKQLTAQYGADIQHLLAFCGLRTGMPTHLVPISAYATEKFVCIISRDPVLQTCAHALSCWSQPCLLQSCPPAQAV